jgi:uncharacterized membrane protein YedE/YeeE
MIEFTPVSALVGGGLIGFAAVLLLKFNGRIAGISGIVNGALTMQSGDRLWRLLFILGLVIGGYLYQVVTAQPLVTREGFPMGLLIVAGLLVGFGTRLGSGCTSGHGVCGIARLSSRSIVATLAFLSTGIFTASVFYLALGRAA